MEFEFTHMFIILSHSRKPTENKYCFCFPSKNGEHSKTWKKCPFTSSFDMIGVAGDWTKMTATCTFDNSIKLSRFLSSFRLACLCLFVQIASSNIYVWILVYMKSVAFARRMERAVGWLFILWTEGQSEDNNNKELKWEKMNRMYILFQECFHYYKNYICDKCFLLPFICLSFIKIGSIPICSHSDLWLFHYFRKCGHNTILFSKYFRVQTDKKSWYSIFLANRLWDEFRQPSCSCIDSFVKEYSENESKLPLICMRDQRHYHFPPIFRKVFITRETPTNNNLYLLFICGPTDL